MFHVKLFHIDAYPELRFLRKPSDSHLNCRAREPMTVAISLSNHH